MMTHARFMDLHKDFPFPVIFTIDDGSCWKTKYAGLKFCGDEEDSDLMVLLYDSPCWSDFEREIVVEAKGAVDLFIAINHGRDHGRR